MKARILFFRIALVTTLLGAAATAFAAEKDTAYYRAAIGKSRYELKTALYNIIKDHTALKYDDLWKAFETTDQRPDNDTLAWDIYSNCDLPFYAHYGPNTSEECYQLNREHSFPNSWFGGEATRKEPKYNDLFHMYPVSGRVNTIRNDNPYGKVQEGKDNFKSSNGSLRGPSATPGFTGTVFEPIDEYKGDLARTYFYMVTRYENEVADWDTVYNKGGEKACVVCNGTSTQAMQDWAVALFLEWHRQDPVSQKEIARNDSIYTIQHNRNPFIDFPELVEKIWGDDSLAFGTYALVTSTEPEGYYKDAYGKSSYTLKTALHGIIKGHTEISYSGLWEAYKKTDARADGTVWDMYSDCAFTFGSDQCGNYKNECDCYNREHSFPKSWFNDAKPMYSDLFHLYPTDGKVNGMRGNNPFGEVSNPTYTSNNGGKLGPNITNGYSGTVFEPVDEYKGDFARSYFYMATRYEDKIADWSACPICDGNNKASFKQWTVDLLLKWHREDPVSEKEVKRNGAVYEQQHNRNPFIDYPELVEKIWGNDDTPFKGANPNPKPDPEPEPDDPEPEGCYALPYVYKDAEGGVLLRDTVYVPAPSVVQTQEATQDVLLSEDFEKLTGTDIGSTTFDITKCEKVESVDGKVYAVVSGVRLAANAEAGQVNFKKFDCTGDFYVTVDGKGWNASRRNCKILCDVCTVQEQEITFTKDKETLTSGNYETLAPVKFTVRDGQTQVTLSVRAEAAKQVLIGKVEVSGELAQPAPEVGYSGITIGYPAQDEELLDTLLEARVLLDRDDEEGESREEVKLPKIRLRNGGAYSLEVSMLLDDNLIDSEAVDFTVKLVASENPNDPKDPEDPNDPNDPTPDTVKAPTFAPGGGEVEKGTEVTMTCVTEDARIYYTVNGEVPTAESTEYTVAVSIDSAVTIKAIAIKEGMEKSPVVEAAYTIKETPVVTPNDTTGTEQAEELDFKVYPNPNQGDFFVDVPARSRVEVFSAQGVLLKRLEKVSGLQNMQVQGAGLYIVRVSVGEKVAVKRVIVE